MDLESITEQLAKKHDLEKKQFLKKTVPELYPVKGEFEFVYWREEQDRLLNSVLIRESKKWDESCEGNMGSFAKFFAEINPIIAPENLELIHVHKTYTLGSEFSIFHQTLIENTRRRFTEWLNGDLKLYSGCNLAYWLDELLEENKSEVMEDVLRGISRGYEQIKTETNRSYSLPSI